MLTARRRWVVLLLTSLVSTLNVVHAEPPATELLKLHTREAQAYHLYADEKRTAELELQTKPVFTWTNVAADHQQLGHLFVWTRGGRPEVIATIFSTRHMGPKQRAVIHEFHTLSTAQVFADSPEGCMYDWKPERGITISPCDGAPSVALASPARMSQMRAIARSFSAESRGSGTDKWDLRLLTTPLLHYKPESPDVLEGTLFAMVSSAGTDPEVLLLIEARPRSKEDKTWIWYAAALRFSDKDLIVKRNDKLLWSSLEDRSHKADIKNNYTLIETPDRTYSCYRSHIMKELPDAEK